MADRDLMELNGHVEDVDEQVDTVIGAGRVGLLASYYEERRHRIITAGADQGMGVRGTPTDALVTRTEAAIGMQNVEQRTAQMVAGSSAQAAHAINVLSEQAASAVQQTAETSHRAVSTLEGRTREAFGRAETAMTSMQHGVSSNADRITELETALRRERQRNAEAEARLRDDQQRTIEQLTKRLNTALAKVDDLSADLAIERSWFAEQPQRQPEPAILSSQTPLPAPVEYSRPPHMDRRSEIRADFDDQPSPAHSSHGASSGRSRSRSTSSHRSRHSRSSSSARHTAEIKSQGPAPAPAEFSGIFDVQIKPKDPPAFSGRTSEDPEIWVGQVSNFFRLVGGPPRKQVAYASTLLTGMAQTWWQRKIKAGEEPQDWSTFAAQLIGRFQNTCKADAAMANLMNIKQKKEESTHDFICRFESELDKVETYDETWVLKMFIWGLPSDQAVLVSQGRPKTLSKAFQLARDAALAAQMSRRPGSSSQDPKGGQKSSGRNQSKPTGQQGQGSGTSGTGHSKVPNFVYANKNFQGGNRGRGQAGRPPVPPQAPVVGYQPNQRQQPAGSGQRGRPVGNQRKPRVAVIATQVDEVMAGQVGQDAAQHAAVTGTDASLHQGQGN